VPTQVKVNLEGYLKGGISIFTFKEIKCKECYLVVDRWESEVADRGIKACNSASFCVLWKVVPQSNGACEKKECSWETTFLSNIFKSLGLLIECNIVESVFTILGLVVDNIPSQLNQRSFISKPKKTCVICLLTYWDFLPGCLLKIRYSTTLNCLTGSKTELHI